MLSCKLTSAPASRRRFEASALAYLAAKCNEVSPENNKKKKRNNLVVPNVNIFKFYPNPQTYQSCPWLHLVELLAPLIRQ